MGDLLKARVVHQVLHVVAAVSKRITLGVYMRDRRDSGDDAFESGTVSWFAHLSSRPDSPMGHENPASRRGYASKSSRIVWVDAHERFWRRDKAEEMRLTR